MIRAKKIVDGRVPLPARSGHISENRGTILGKSRRGRVCMYGHTYSKSMDQPGKVTSPARGQLNRKNEYFPVRVRA